MAFESSNYRAQTHINPAVAAEKLNGIISRGVSSARATYEHAMTATISDALVRDTAIIVESDKSVRLALANPEGRGHLVHDLTDHALGQLCTRYGMPAKFARELLAHPSEHVRQLVGENLETLARQQEKPGRALIRVSDGKVKAVLSDSFRRVDSRPMIQAFVETCQAQGLVPTEGMVTDTRIAIKALVPMVHYAAGDAIAFGMQLKNSDFGAGAFECKVFCLRLWCANGALLETAMRQVHLGRKLDEGTFSQKTYDLDSATSISAMRDVIGKALAPESVESWVNVINENGREGFDAAKAFDALQKGGKIGKAEKTKIVEVYNSADVEMLPPGNTAWRASNAISWFAKDESHGGDRKLELEKLAGDMLTVPA